MKQIDSRKLSNLVTLITEFMLDRTKNYKTFSELVVIFENCYQQMNGDPSSDKRILKFSDDMESGNWEGDIKITVKNGMAIDGIHRGIAYLTCIKKKVPESNLPKIIVVRQEQP